MRKEIILAIFLISFTLIAGYFLNNLLVQRKPHMKLFGTEYSPGDSGRVFLQLLDEKFKPINNALCLISVYYPDKTEWFRNVSMFYLPGSDGLYYFDFIAPADEGVYMVSAKCFYVIEQTYDYADSYNLVKGNRISGTIENTWKDDSVYLTFRENLLSDRLEVWFEFDDVRIPANNTGMTIYWVGRWEDPHEYLKVYLYDFCNSTWLELPNRVTTNTPMVSNYLDASVYNISCFVGGGKVGVKFEDQAVVGTAEYFRVDFLDVQMHYATYGQINNIRGGGEIHVSTKKFEPSEEMPGISIIS